VDGISPGGRPKQGREVKRRYQVMLEPRIAERLRKLGKGNLSRGIAEAYRLTKGEM
jgi:hypothetical protein